MEKATFDADFFAFYIKLIFWRAFSILIKNRSFFRKNFINRCIRGIIDIQELTRWWRVIALGEKKVGVNEKRGV